MPLRALLNLTRRFTVQVYRYIHMRVNKVKTNFAENIRFGDGVVSHDITLKIEDFVIYSEKN